MHGYDEQKIDATVGAKMVKWLKFYLNFFFNAKPQLHCGYSLS